VASFDREKKGSLSEADYRQTLTLNKYPFNPPPELQRLQRIGSNLLLSDCRKLLIGGNLRGNPGKQLQCLTSLKDFLLEKEKTARSLSKEFQPSVTEIYEILKRNGDTELTAEV